MQIQNLGKYVSVLDNGLMQMIGEKPIEYTLHAQFRSAFFVREFIFR